MASGRVPSSSRLAEEVRGSTDVPVNAQIPPEAMQGQGALGSSGTPMDQEEVPDSHVPPQPTDLTGVFQALHHIAGLLEHQEMNNRTASSAPQQNAPVGATDTTRAERKLSLIRDFRRLNPKPFGGEVNVDLAEKWIKGVKKLIDLAEIPENLQVEVATSLFTGEADYWWDQIRRTHDVSGMLWEEFERVFYERYFRESARTEKFKEFLELKQRGMTVEQYEGRFTELSRFGAVLLGTEADRARRFLQGLRPAIRGQLVALRVLDYGDLVERAIMVERELTESSRDEGRPRPNVRTAPYNPQQRRWSGATSNFRSGESPGSWARGSSSLQGNRGSNVTCYECGQQGHIRMHCPRLGARRMNFNGRAPGRSSYRPVQGSYGQTGSSQGSWGRPTPSARGSRVVPSAKGKEKVNETAPSGRLYSLATTRPDEQADNSMVEGTILIYSSWV